MVATKTETKNYGDAIRLYFDNKEEYEMWLQKFKEMAESDTTDEDTKKSILFVIEKIEKRMNETPFENNATLGKVDSLVFMSEVSMIVTIFMKLVLQLSEVTKLYKDSEEIVTKILDGNR